MPVLASASSSALLSVAASICADASYWPRLVSVLVAELIFLLGQFRETDKSPHVR